MVKINFVRGKVWEFAELPEKSIALDGAVMGPRMDNQRRVYSFDHHGNCVRHSSSATCVQVLDAVLLGLQPESFNVFINDIDEDTVIAASLLVHPEMARSEKVQEFTRHAGLLDAHGPAYPLPAKFRGLIYSFQEIVMESFGSLKLEKHFTEDELQQILHKYIANFKRWAEEDFPAGRTEKKANRTYHITPDTGKNWVMVTSDTYIFDLVYKDGYTRIITWKQMADKTYSYTVGKKSEFVDFPVREILDTLNEIEPGWGGGSTIGGSPRHQDGSRSRLPPEKVVEIVNNYLDRKVTGAP
jgi:hypothetical protein